MNTTIENLVKELTEDQKQLLKDTITHGFWGDDYAKFVDNKGNVEEHSADGYCTNDAKRAGHFSGRKISAMFRAITRNFASMEIKENFLPIILIGGVMVLVICSSFATIL